MTILNGSAEEDALRLQVAAYKPEPQLRKEVKWAKATLEVPGLPPFMCARMLRSAVGEEMNRLLGAQAHAEWLGKDGEDGETVKRQARVYYRYSDRTPQVFIWDDLAFQHVQALAGLLTTIRIDSEAKGPQFLPITGMSIQRGTALLGQNQCHRYLYEFASPLFPTDRQWARRPREPGIWRNHWTIDSIQGCVEGLLKTKNLYCNDITIAPVNLSETRVVWSRPQRSLETHRQGITGRFIANIEIPNGLAIGRHGAEGYGELRFLERFDVPKG